MNATLIHRRDLHERLAIVQIAPDVAVPPFVPGQFFQIGVRRLTDTGQLALEKRAYSVASSATERASAEFLITLVPEGRVTPHLWQLAIGSRCWLDPVPHGHFTLEHVPRDRDVLFVATGSGIAPYVSMLRTHAPTERRWHHCVLIHGVRQREDLAYREELSNLAELRSDVCYLPVLSREPEESWSGLRGRVQSVLSSERFHEAAGCALDPARCHVFLCGNPRMIEETRAMLVGRGFVAGSARRGGNVHVERYW
jgi:ferredoxin--NADP+ reductase